MGKSILNYLRAQRLIPDDPDLKSNLAYAKSLIKSRGIVSKRNWFRRLFLGLVEKVNLDDITLFTTALYFIFSALVIIAIIVKESRRIFIYIRAGTLALLIVCVVLFSAQFYKTVIQKEAIVITQTSNCKFEPFDEATTFFTLYEGEKVVITTLKKIGLNCGIRTVSRAGLRNQMWNFFKPRFCNRFL